MAEDKPQHMGAPGKSDTIVALINARFKDVVFSLLGHILIKLYNENSPTHVAVYGARIDRYCTGDALALAICMPSDLAATTIDNLMWTQLHLRTYEGTDDLFSQFQLEWDNLGNPQPLAIDAYNDVDVKVYEDSTYPEVREKGYKPNKHTRTYRTRDGTVALTLRAPSGDPRGLGGNDLPKETTFVPALEQFNTVIWFA
jgi:hypothetical protein